MTDKREMKTFKSNVNKRDSIIKSPTHDKKNHIAISGPQNAFENLIQKKKYEEEAANSLEEYIKESKKSNCVRRNTRGEFSDWSPNVKRLLDTRTKIREYKKMLSSLQQSKDSNNSKRNKKKYVLRISRLRSKERHEENKIKLLGLVAENTRLEYYIAKTKIYLQLQIYNAKDRQHLLEKTNMTLNDRVAGNCEIFVEDVLEEIESTKQKKTINDGKEDSANSKDKSLIV